MSDYVLGLDCSSTTIGWCVLKLDNNNIIYVDSGYIKPPKKGSIVDKLVKTRSEIINIYNKYKPKYVGIEEIIQFMKGKSTAKTIITLTTFNRMICLSCYDSLSVYPELFNVMSIRHGLKTSKTLPSKEDIPEIVANHLNIKFPYEYNKKNNLKVENYDRADGIAVALFYAFKLTNKIKKGKKK